MEAFVWKTGLVEFGRTTPKGALKIAEGKGQSFKKDIQIKCRLAYPVYIDGVEQAQRYLLPGVPEAQTNDEALEAVERFVNWIHGRSYNTKEEVEKAVNKLGGQPAKITIET